MLGRDVILLGRKKRNLCECVCVYMSVCGSMEDRRSFPCCMCGEGGGEVKGESGELYI